MALPAPQLPLAEAAQGSRASAAGSQSAAWRALPGQTPAQPPKELCWTLHRCLSFTVVTAMPSAQAGRS